MCFLWGFLFGVGKPFLSVLRLLWILFSMIGIVSLTEKEVPYVNLTKDNNRSKFAFAAKFLTKQVLNIEATGQTFKPLWKTRRSFQAQDVGNHVIIFVFETNNDAKRVLMDGPWRFDKHLVLFQRYESGRAISGLQFTHVPFWLQIHDLPVNKLNEETAENLGNIVDTAIHSQFKEDLMGYDFMRIRVNIDISRQLCRSRWVLLGEDNEGSVSF